jgi:acyl-CoA-binding protein
MEDIQRGVEDLEMAVEDWFDAATVFVGTQHHQIEKDVLLALYGLYKQVG